MSLTKVTVLGLLILSLFVAACGPQVLPQAGNTAGPSSQPGSTAGSSSQPGSTVPEAVQAAINSLSQKTGASASEIQVVSFEKVEWTDSCLGLGGPAESCLQAVTPGYHVVLSVAGKQYEFRTDETGENVRMVEQAGNALPEAVQAAINSLSQTTGVAAGDIQVISSEKVDWTDSCLGLGGPAESCLQAITPGWHIVLSAGGKQYEFRTDETGQNIRLVEP